MNDRALILERVIELGELSYEGRDFLYTRESGELNEALSELLGDRPYQLKFFLRPAGNSFEMTGEIKTSLPLLCSRCAIDFEYEVIEPFSEILIVQPPLDRKAKSSHANHMTESTKAAPFCSYLESEQFDVGEWAHEIIALSEPQQPLGKPDCDASCENYINATEKGWLISEKSEKESPFDALKDLKIPSSKMN